MRRSCGGAVFCPAAVPKRSTCCLRYCGARYARQAPGGYSDQLLVDRLTQLSRLVNEETIYLISSPEYDPDPEAARMLMPYIPRLKKLVRPGSMTAVTSPGPGMGKTELLTLYCRVFREEYSAVVWLDCRRDLTDQLEFVNNSGRAAYDEEEIRLEKLRLLTECDRDMLFILDNYTPEVPGNILNRFVRRATCIAALSRPGGFHGV